MMVRLKVNILVLVWACLFGLSHGACKDMKVYWQVPTMQCHKHGMDFLEVSESYGILQNKNDAFRGDIDVISVLYDPGKYPAYHKNKEGKMETRNGGMPHKGNYAEHIEAFEKFVNEQVKDPNFNGPICNDMESWRPIFDQLWGVMTMYKNATYKDICGTETPDKACKEKAKKTFEDGAKKFMLETALQSKKIRPKAQWGYYIFPLCFMEKNGSCSINGQMANDRLTWLWESSDVLFPSAYLQNKYTPEVRKQIVIAKVKEAERVRKAYNPKAQIIVYQWYKYQDKDSIFLTPEDMEMSLREACKNGAEGVIIWGASADVNSKDKCQALRDYLKKTLGPLVLKIRKGE